MKSRPLIVSPSVASSGMLDVVPFLPSTKQLETGDFDLGQITKGLTEALADESQRNEILQLTRDNAVPVIECLDRVSEIVYLPDAEFSSRSRSSLPTPL